MLGAWVEYHQGPWPLGRRAAQHVETDAGSKPVDAWRQPASVATLFAVPVAADQGTYGRHSNPGLRAAGGASPELTEGQIRRGHPGDAERLSRKKAGGQSADRNRWRAALEKPE